MTVKVTMANGGSDSVDFVNNSGTTLAQVKVTDGGSSNGSLALYTTASGTASEKVRVDKDGNVGIGTSTPACKTDVAGAIRSTSIGAPASGAGLELSYGGTANTADILAYDRTGAAFKNIEMRCSNLIFNTGGGGERARIDSSGNLLVGKTSTATTALGWNLSPVAGNAKFDAGQYFVFNRDTNDILINFRRSDTSVGNINVTTTATAYVTSSDYRLKENIAPMTGALATVAQLKPCTYSWKIDASDGQGFIAHELAEVVPDCVTGEKDAVDADGNPVYQGIDTSFLVATLTAAIQELKAIVDEQAAKITALENK
jgi:hypothetical protein